MIHWRGDESLRPVLGTTCAAPGFYRFSLPHPWLMDLADKPQIIDSLSKSTEGSVTLAYTAPAGDPLLADGSSGFAPVTTIVELESDGSIRRWSTLPGPDTKWKSPKVIARLAPGISVQSLSDDWTIV